MRGFVSKGSKEHHICQDESFCSLKSSKEDNHFQVIYLFILLVHPQNLVTQVVGTYLHVNLFFCHNFDIYTLVVHVKIKYLYCTHIFPIYPVLTYQCLRFIVSMHKNYKVLLSYSKYFIIKILMEKGASG